MCPAPKTKTSTTDTTNPNAKKLDASQSPMSSMNLQTCTPDALAEYLLHNRFANDETKALAFLQAAAKAVPKASGSSLDAASPPSSDLPSIDLGDALLEEPLETSLIAPRAGKFRIQFHQNGLLATKLNDPSITLFVPSSSVSHILLFAKPEDIKTICNVTKSKKPKPPNAHLVLLQLGRSVPFQNKELSQICFALSWNKADGPTGPKRAAGGDSATTTTTTSTGGGWRQATMAWRSVLQTSMPNAIFSQVQPTSTTTRTSSSEDDPQQQQQQTQQPFRSYSDPGQSSTTGNMPFVKCYYGVQDGVLYPLEEGLLFFKPAKFIPRSELHSIACGRGGQNASRYVDMHLQLNGNDGDDDNNANDDDTKPLVEFTNIQREELGVLNKYIQEVLIPAMKRDVRESNRSDKKNTKKTNDDEGADDETEEEVDDVEVVDGDENETDDEESDDDDDENFEEGGSDKEDDEDGNDDSDSDDDEDEDEGDECEVVKDDFAQELAKRKKDDSDTESDESGDGSRPKRRRTRGS